MSETAITRPKGQTAALLHTAHTSLAIAAIPSEMQSVLFKMFADPRLLEKSERTNLIASLRECVAAHPKSSELRVLYGMALCVNLNAQEAMEELGEAVKLAPDSFIAHLKMGELWMRLRVCQKAADHTQRAAQLAQNLAQSELARRQATTIRTMLREGIDRGGYSRTAWFSWTRLGRLWKRRRTGELAPVEAR